MELREYCKVVRVMDANFEAKYHRLEETQWWFRSRRNFICQLLKAIGIQSNAAVLEVGCSGGSLLLDLDHAGYTKIKGIELSQKAIDRARQRGLTDIELMDAANLEFGDACFDVVIASDVLEHIEHDANAVLEWKRVLKPGGQLLIFVPALELLWSCHDEANRHFRRYSASGLREIVHGAGLALDRVSYWNFVLTFPGLAAAVIRRVLPGRRGNTTGRLFELPKLVNGALFTLLRTENQFLRFTNFPFGTSVFAIARKPAWQM